MSAHLYQVPKDDSENCAECGRGLEDPVHIAIPGPRPEPYRPSSGTEGDGFFNAWCCRCARDKSMSEGKNFDDCAPEEICPIIADTFAYDVDDPLYPKEWIYGEDGRPKCTAFIPAGQPVPIRCEKTIDMFREPK